MVIIAIHILSYLFLIPYLLSKRLQYLRFFSHAIWIILCFSTIITFTVGGSFGILGNFSKDMVNVFNYVFSDENLLSPNRRLITSKSTAQIFSVCINSRGTIPDQLDDVSNSEVDHIQQFYAHTMTLNSFKNSISNLNSNKLNSIQEIKNILSKIKDDVTLINEDLTDPNNPVNILNEMRKWSDSTYNGNYQTKCDKPTQDAWAQIIYKCPSSSNNCLLFKDNDLLKINQRYNQQSLNCKVGTKNDFSSVNDAIVAYFNGFTKLVSQNEQVINKLITEIDK